MMSTIPSTSLTLGDRLARARDVARLSQGDLAARLGLSRATVSNYENDVRGKVPFAIVCQWALATNVPLSFFADATLSDGEEALTIWFLQRDSREESGGMVAPLPHALPVVAPTPEHPQFPFADAA